MFFSAPQLKRDSLDSAHVLVKLNDLLDLAERSFGFIRERGFELVNRVPAPNDYFRQGWVLEYRSRLVDVRIEYGDWEFNVVFTYGPTKASYLMIDRELHARRSGFHGDMFPPEKLAGVIEQIAGDIRAHYSDVLAGEDATWAKLKRLSEAPTTKRKLP